MLERLFLCEQLFHLLDKLGFGRVDDGGHAGEVFLRVLKALQRAFAVIASMRRTPAEIDPSYTILQTPMSPVRLTCVPPQSSY